MKLYSLRDPYHKLPNMMNGITVGMGGFSVIYTEHPERIDLETKEKLGSIIRGIEEYYERAVETLDEISDIFGIIGFPDLADNLKMSLRGYLKEIKDIIDKTKNLYNKISNDNLKDDILNIVKEMQPFKTVCKAVGEAVSEDTEKLKSYGIYNKLYNEKGEIVAKLFFADHEKETNTKLKSYFEQKGYVVFTINDNDDISHAMIKERPNVVYLDAKLPGEKSGFKALKEIKELDKRIKVIFKLDETKEDLEEEGLSADAYLKKPFDLMKLEEIVNKLVPSGRPVIPQ